MNIIINNNLPTDANVWRCAYIRYKYDVLELREKYVLDDFISDEDFESTIIQSCCKGLKFYSMSDYVKHSGTMKHLCNRFKVSANEVKIVMEWYCKLYTDLDYYLSDEIHDMIRDNDIITPELIQETIFEILL